MAARFDPPPGWPQPPAGWSPPPGWQPDPTWPPAPPGWQFWVDDAPATTPWPTPPAAQAPSAALHPDEPGRPQDAQPTQVFGQAQGAPPTQAMPQQGGLYSYAPSSGLDQPGRSPYGPGGGSYPGGGGPGGPGSGAPQPGGPSPRRNVAVPIVAGVVGVLVVGALVWGVAALVRGGDEDQPPPTAAPTTDDPTPDPTTDDPTTDPPPTDDPTTDDPTDDPTDPGAAPAGEYVDLTGDDPAVVLGASGDPIVEVRLVSVERDWEPSGGLIPCPDPSNGTYILAELEYTTLDALRAEPDATFTELGYDPGAEGPTGDLAGTPLLGTLCGVEAPVQMPPGQTQTGQVLIDVPADVTALTYTNRIDITGASPVYRWVLEDQ